MFTRNVRYRAATVEKYRTVEVCWKWEEEDFIKVGNFPAVKHPLPTAQQGNRKCNGRKTFDLQNKLVPL